MLISRGLGIVLSLVFGGLLLALVAELYYLLWWKKIRISTGRSVEDFSTLAKDLFHLFCLKKPSSINNQSSNEISTILTNTEANRHDPDIELGSSKDVLLKAFGEDVVESEITRLQNLAGTRFLFTIKEETKEDLESDDGKSKGDRSRKGSRTRSLSDLMFAVETSFLSPLSSPPLMASAALDSLHPYTRHGFNPLFESSVDAELNRLRASPPPKFKFLRDAEEKLYRRLLEEAEKLKARNCGRCQIAKAKDSQLSMAALEEAEKNQFSNYGGFRISEAKGSHNSSMAARGTVYKDASSLEVNVADNKVREINQHHQLQQQCHASSSQAVGCS
ncbi:hypothetical protein Nepgr_014132 [Nepenthes gracilis]|uniref:Uncharacterized protein n=1 Tax=Nepenthes gracilis TaxID=150966 RepID=A0AAD3SKG3_NEPGR|nr:hypothetical protein Nepgr_014132 [Nepenthes gracilis]